MNKKIIISSVLLVVAVVFVFFVSTQNKNKNQAPEDENQIILFYGDGCPHCAVVDKYIKDNKVEDKVTFTRKEVFNNRNNLKDLKKKAEACNLPTNSLGVPFLWDGKNCLMGEQDVTNFFQQKINEL